MQTVLSPEQCKGLNCFDACLINHVNSRYHEYACAFSNGYYFVFHPQIDNNQTHIGLSLHQSKKNTIHNKCHKYYGTYAQKTENDSPLETLNELTAKKQDTLIVISAFWCPWSTDYQKNDIDHAVIIRNQMEGIILCADPMLTGKIHELPIDHFIKGCKSIYKLHTKKQRVPYELAWKDFILYMKSIHVEQALTDFFDTLEALQDIAAEFPNNEISLLDRALSYYLPGSRQMLHYFLQHINNKLNREIHEQILEISSTLAQDWEMLRALILHAHYKKSYSATKYSILRLGESIMERETKLVNYFQNQRI